MDYGTAVMLLEANVGPQSKKEQTISLLGMMNPALLIALSYIAELMGMDLDELLEDEDILDVIRGVISSGAIKEEMTLEELIKKLEAMPEKNEKTKEFTAYVKVENDLNKYNLALADFYDFSHGPYKTWWEDIDMTTNPSKFYPLTEDIDADFAKADRILKYLEDKRKEKGGSIYIDMMNPELSIEDMTIKQGYEILRGSSLTNFYSGHELVSYLQKNHKKEVPIIKIFPKDDKLIYNEELFLDLEKSMSLQKNESLKAYELRTRLIEELVDISYMYVPNSIADQTHNDIIFLSDMRLARYYTLDQRIKALEFLRTNSYGIADGLNAIGIDNIVDQTYAVALSNISASGFNMDEFIFMSMISWGIQVDAYNNILTNELIASINAVPKTGNLDLISRYDYERALIRAESPNVRISKPPKAAESSVAKKTMPKDYLDDALKQQGLSTAPNNLKHTWTENGYKYEVRIHAGESTYTSSSRIYRVSRQEIVTSGQGTGTFYLGSDGVWYHTSVLRQFNGDGSLNALFNSIAAEITHIPLP